MNIKSYKYDILNDKEWLEQKYLVEKLSTREISNIVGCKCPNSVRQSLIRFGIKPCSISEGITRNREDEGFCLNTEVINGSLLGDGSLIKWNKTSYSSFPHFKKKNKYLDHIELVAKNIFSGDFSKKIKTEKRIHKYKGTEKELSYYVLRTHSHQELSPLFEKWYPKTNNYKKVVPRDLVLTPTTILHWFLDDGYSYSRKRKNQEKKQIVIEFCSECFSEEDNLFLLNQLRDKFKLNGWLHKTKSGCRIGITQAYSDLFFNIIGSPPVASLSYKWK